MRHDELTRARDIEALAEAPARLARAPRWRAWLTEAGRAMARWIVPL